MRLLMVIVGSGLGGGLRLLLSVALQERLGPSFPYGTLAVNLIGSFALGVFFSFRDRGLLLDPDLWFLLATGICGGFTTMSTFSLETLLLLRQREVYYATLNVALSVAGCLIAVAGGYLSFRWLTVLR